MSSHAQPNLLRHAKGGFAHGGRRLVFDLSNWVGLACIAALVVLYLLSQRNKARRHPFTGQIQALWLSPEAADLLAKFDLILERLPTAPRWTTPLPSRGVIVVHIHAPPEVRDGMRYTLHLERNTGRLWVTQRGGFDGVRLVYGPLDIHGLVAPPQPKN